MTKQTKFILFVLIELFLSPQLILTETNSINSNQSVHLISSVADVIQTESIEAGITTIIPMPITTTKVPPSSQRKAHSASQQLKRKQNEKPKSLESSSTLLETKVINTWKRTDSRVLFIDDLLNRKVGAKFYDARIYNYSQFVVLPKQSAIYVVENKVTLLKLDMTTFFLLDSYTLPTPEKLIPNCPNSMTCHQAKEISLLAVMPNDQMVWFCYLHYFEHVNRPPQYADSACMVPQPGNLAEPVVQWGNPHFNSLDPTQLASVLNANDGFTYISAFAPDYLRIFRAHMPDWNGRVNWTGALVTAKSRIHIAEPAQILLTFETENEVYFVLREQQTNSFRSARFGAHRGSDFDGTASKVARLIRICKGDRGGLPQRSAEHFGTFAKADLHCAASDNSGGSFAYTQLQAVYWENATERLFASFGTEKWAPVGSALCVYSKRDIEAAFSGPLLQPAIPGVSQAPKPFPNSFANICQRFNSNNLTSEELAIGRRISLTFPNRNNPIEPMYKRALIVQTGVAWIHLQTYSLPPLPTNYHFGNPAHTTIIWLGTKVGLTKLAVYEAPEVIQNGSNRQPVICKLNELLVGRSLDLLNRPQAVKESPKVRVFHQEKSDTHQSTHSDSLVLPYLRRSTRRYSHSLSGKKSEEIRQIGIHFPRIFIITDRQLLWLPLTDCSSYKTFNECIRSGDPHCGWSWPEERCANGYDMTPTLSTSWFNTYSPSIDRRRPENARCPEVEAVAGSKGQPGAWSAWYTCRWLNGDEPQYESVDPNVPVKIYSRSYGTCRCRVCLSQTDCVLGTQEVINCTRHERDWLQWSAWSRCDITTSVQTRHRTCRPGAVCIGSSREQRLCTPEAIWSSRFGALVATAPFYEKTGVSDYRKVGRSSSIPQEGFSMTHMILVALCSALIGGLVTGLIFCLLWQPCCIFPTVPDCTKFHRKRFSQKLLQMPSDYQPKHDNQHRIVSKTGEEKWTIQANTDQPWFDSKSDDAANWSKTPQSSELYETFLNHHFKVKKTCYRERRSKHTSARCGSSSLHLLTGSPLPSPTSAVSGPSTASTVLKDKFTFDNIDGNDDATVTSSLCVPSTTPSFKLYHPRATGHTAVTVDNSTGSSVEKLPQTKASNKVSTELSHQSEQPHPSWSCTEPDRLKTTHLKSDMISEQGSLNSSARVNCRT